MKKTSFFIVVVMTLLLIMTGCLGKHEAKSETYENTKFGITLLIPNDWNGKYAIEEVDSETPQLHFINLNNKPYGGILFTITSWPKEKWDTDGLELKKNIHLEELASKNDIIYTINTPTDVQYDVQNEERKNEYSTMFHEVKNIQESFKVK